MGSRGSRDLAKVLARKAEGDAKAMRRLVPDPKIDDEAMGFHAQQAIEKCFKAVMARRGLEKSAPTISAACWSFLAGLEWANIQLSTNGD